MNTKNKTGRKNNLNQTLILPSTNYFSTEQLFDANPKMLNITARTKFKLNYLSTGKVKELGYIQNPMGRPTKVYAMTPISNEIIDSAKNDGIILKSEYIVEKVTDINVNNTVSSQHNSTPKIKKFVFSN